MGTVIGVVTGHLASQVRVSEWIDATVGEELADGGGDRGRRLGGAALLAYDAALPLIQQLVGPHDAVDAVLGESEEKSITENGNSTLVSTKTFRTAQYGRRASASASETRR